MKRAWVRLSPGGQAYSRIRPSSSLDVLFPHIKQKAAHVWKNRSEHPVPSDRGYGIAGCWEDSGSKLMIKSFYITSRLKEAKLLMKV